MADNVVFVTITQFTTIHAPTGFTTLVSSMKSSAAPVTSDIISSVLTSAPSSSHLPTGSPTSNTSSPTPSSGAVFFEHPKNNTFAIIILVAVILISVLFLGGLGFLIYQLWRGECQKCKEKDREMRMLVKGDPITKAIIKERELSMQARLNCATQSSQQDTEKRVFKTVEEGITVGGPAYQVSPSMAPSPTASTKESRSSALARLEGNNPALSEAVANRDNERNKGSFFQRLKRLKSIKRDTHEDGEGEIKIGYLEPEPSVSTLNQPPGAPTAPPQIHVSDSPYAASSNYQNPYVLNASNIDTDGPRQFSTYDSLHEDVEHRGAPVLTRSNEFFTMERIEADDLAADYRRACYEAGQEDNPNRAEAQRTRDQLAEQIAIRYKRRTGGYGGMTPPTPSTRAEDGMQDVDLEGQDAEEKQGFIGRIIGK